MVVDFAVSTCFSVLESTTTTTATKQTVSSKALSLSNTRHISNVSDEFFEYFNRIPNISDKLINNYSNNNNNNNRTKSEEGEYERVTVWKKQCFGITWYIHMALGVRSSSVLWMFQNISKYRFTWILFAPWSPPLCSGPLVYPCGAWKISSCPFDFSEVRVTVIVYVRLSVYLSKCQSVDDH